MYSPEGMLKGKMAETLVEELLRHSGNEVYRFGYEAVLQNLAQLETKFDRAGKTGTRIRTIPDFIVLDKKGEPTFVEVKFRWNSHFDEKGDPQRLALLADQWDAALVVVNCWEKPYFRIASPPYLNSRGTPVLRPLLGEKTWKISRELYDECEKLIEKYFTPTLVSLRNKAFRL